MPDGDPDVPTDDREFADRPHEVLRGIQIQVPLFAFVPVESRFDIRLDRELGFDCVSLHLDLRASRSITSMAGWEEDGFWRYRRKRSSASCR